MRSDYITLCLRLSHVQFSGFFVVISLMILWWTVNKILSISPRMIFDLCVVFIFLFLQFPWRKIHILPVQWHSIALGLFASVIAPFGGFFASGFKRAFKIKVNLPSWPVSFPTLAKHLVVGTFYSPFSLSFLRILVIVFLDMVESLIEWIVRWLEI